MLVFTVPLATAIVLLAGLVAMLPARPAEAQKPNILFMLVDNLGYGELGVYGGGATRGAPTPRIDRLASEGLRLTNMNMEAQCTPSRSSILTGRYAIRSGTHSVPFGGVADGLTQWEVTMAEALSAAGLRDRALRQVASRQPGWPPAERSGFRRVVRHPAHDRRGAVARLARLLARASCRRNRSWRGARVRRAVTCRVYDLEQRRLMDAEITRRSIAFMERQAQARKPFFAYATLTQPHLPTLPNPAFAGKTGNGDWADMLAEMDHNVGQMLDAVDRLGIRDNTIVIFASDNGPEFVKPWDGWAGPWRGQYFTALEGGIRVPFMIRWPGRMPAGRVSDEIVHGVDLFPTLASIAGADSAERSPDRRRGPVRLLPGQDREVRPRRHPDLVRRPPAGGEVAQFQGALLPAGDDGLAAGEARQYRCCSISTQTRARTKTRSITDSWVIGPVLKMIGEFEAEREEASADRDGHARPLCAGFAVTRGRPEKKWTCGGRLIRQWKVPQAHPGLGGESA